MNFFDFRLKIKEFPLVSIQNLKLAGIYNPLLKMQLSRWVGKNKIIKLRKNIYILNSDERRINPSRMFLAKQIYSPSYISMEYALSYYGLIPERVADITSLTTRKTAIFKNEYGVFSYRHVQPCFFTGFTESRDEENLFYFIATPEKAVVDFIYFNMAQFSKNEKEVFLESFRFQNLERLKKNKMASYAQLVRNRKLFRIVKELGKLIRRQ